MAKSLDALLKKREALEREIEQAKANEKRKIVVMDMPEFVNILSLPDTVLRAAFQKIAAEHQPQQ